MNVVKHTWKHSRALAAAVLFTLVLSSCGGTPPALPPPPPNTGGFGGGGGGGTVGCIGTTGSPLWNGPIVASFSGGASASLNFGVQLSNLTGTALFNIPQYANNPFQQTSTSTQITMCTTAPGTYGYGGQIQAQLTGSVAYQMYNGYASLGTSVFNGIPTQYAQVTGYVSGVISNGTFYNGYAVIEFPYPLQQYSNQFYSY
jgi:hypothetical protein